MPCLQQFVLESLTRDCQAVELARQTDGELADVHHLLHLTEALLHDLAGFQRDQATQCLLVTPHRLAKGANQFATLGSRYLTPAQVACLCARNRCANLRLVADRHPRQGAAINRRADLHAARAIGWWRQTQGPENGLDVGAVRHSAFQSRTSLA